VRSLQRTVAAQQTIYRGDVDHLGFGEHSADEQAA
jgi:uncharacterized protein (DUF1810 family)